MTISESRIRNDQNNNIFFFFCGLHTTPDSNHDENLWAIFKAKVTKRSPKNLAQLEEVVDNVWQNDVEL